MTNTDGNLAALNAWQKEQDKLEEADLRLETLRSDVAADLFNGYFAGNKNAIQWIDEAIMDDFDRFNNLMSEIHKGGSHIHAYMLKLVEELSNEIVKGRDYEQLESIGLKL